MVKIHADLPDLPVTATAWTWLKNYGVTVKVRDGSSTRGGGYWWPERKLVELFSAQEEAAIHELAHAWWHERRLHGANAAEMMVATVKLTEESDPRYGRASELARQYVYGIPGQADKNSPTGWWRGMLVDGNDWEMFAGLASGAMGQLDRLPPYVRRFYEGLFDESSDA
jgi:hypothetical protein